MADLDAQLDPQVLLAAYNQALGRIGFDAAAQVALNQNGFGSMYNMLIYSRDHIKRMCKVLRERQLNPISINMEQEQLLTAMWHWVKARVRTNQDIDELLLLHRVNCKSPGCHG